MDLEIDQMTIEYGGPKTGVTRAVENANLAVERGEILAILGPSGCGKSSILRAVAGLVPLSSGRISWQGTDLAGVPTHDRGFGLMFQEGQLFSHQDVAGNVEFGLRTGANKRNSHAMRPAERREQVSAMLELVGLAGFERRRVETLSGGQQQRVALARALAPNPRALLLDEPLSSLDRPLREELTGQVRSIIQARGCAAIYVTHDLDEAFTVADRVAVMDAGHVLQQGPAMQLWQNPASEQVARFLGYQIFDAGAHRIAVAPSDLVARTLTAGHHVGGDADDRRTLVGEGVVTGTGLWRGSAVARVVMANGQQIYAALGGDDVARAGAALAGATVEVHASKFVDLVTFL